MKNISSRKWIVLFFSVFLCGAVLLSITAFSVDPFMYYRRSNDNKLLNARFVNMGIIKNYSYNTAIIGSSMIQNFDIPYFRQSSNMNPVKLSIAAMTINECMKMYDLSQEYGDIETYFINVDLHMLDTEFPIDKNSTKFPDYLYDENKINDIKYLLGYEVWFRYLPIDLAVNLAYKLNFNLPQKLKDNTSIDKIEDWSSETNFGKEMVKKVYLNQTPSQSKLDQNDRYIRMTKNIDIYLKDILTQKKPNQEITFGFPPYSALYWHSTIEDNTFPILMEAKNFFISQCSQYEGIRIVDLQQLPEITNLDNYMDKYHFNLDVQKIYADAFIFGGFDVDVTMLEQNKSNLESLIRQFENENKEWLQ